MIVPSIKMYFRKDADNWEFGYLTMELIFQLDLLPGYIDNSPRVKQIFDTYDIIELAAKLKEEEVLFSFKQSIFFLECTNKLALLFRQSDPSSRQKLYEYILMHTARFVDANEFIDYYLYYSDQVVEDFRAEYSKSPELLILFNKILEK